MKGLPRKEEVIKSLIELEKIKGRGITADELGFYIGIDRTNISRYLNQLYKEKRINKKEGRPVIYSSIKSYKNEMNSIKNKSDIIVKNRDSLEMLIGSNQSLKLPVQQAKAAILYPPRGLHTLILGETGVGKSLFAEAMYNFAKDSKIIAAEAPFIRFNCADYSDNPQLVVAQIFGVRRGAFTGADTDREGLLKKADGGIFFLDEVHRLSPQGQEMLFTFIDKGYFRQLGDTEKKVKSEVQIIAATTENPQSYLLKTFTRRIPMVIVLPTLRERKLEERYFLLNEFITEESIRIGKSIYISKNAIISFLLYDCPNNIGQLKSDIQLACAKAFLNYKIKKNNYILVDKSDLQPRIQKGIMRIRECRKEIDNLSQDMADILRFSSEDSILKNIEFHENQIEGSENKSFYSIIENKMENLKARGINETEINDILNIDLEKYFRRYISNITTNVKKDEIAKIVNIKVATVAEKMLSIASEKLNRDFDQKVYFGLALHLQGSIERINSGKKIYHPKLNIIRVENREEFAVAMDIIKIAEKEFHIDIPLDEIGYITMFLAACNDENSEQLEKKVRVLVMMHGTSTTSSMAEVANSLIGEEYVQALDMPLTMKAEDMLEKAKKKVKEIYNEKGILLLVDMGSLVNFGDIISNELEIKIKTIDMVTTLTVIEAGSKAFNGRSLDSIYNLCRDIGKSSMQVSKEDNKYDKELVIITTCFTGEGAAERIKIRISNNLKNIEKVKIIPLNISDREEFFRKVNRLKEKFIILAVVGTIKIVIEDVPFIPAQDVFLSEGINYLENLIDIEYDFLKVRKALSGQLNELNSIKVFSDIRDVIRKIEENLNVRIQHDAQIGILIHITFLIDKLKHGGQELKFKDLENYRHMYNSEFSLIKKILKDLERAYNINIGDNEIAYIVRIVKENIITV